MVELESGAGGLWEAGEIIRDDFVAGRFGGAFFGGGFFHRVAGEFSAKWVSTDRKGPRSGKRSRLQGGGDRFFAERITRGDG